MNVIELRCTSCLAPIDPSLGPVQRCAYCGTPLTIGGAPAGKLRLESCGRSIIQVIKVIREHTGLGLLEAKNLAESAPVVVAEWDDAARVERFRADLVAVGASATTGGHSAYRSAPAGAPVRGGAFLEDAGPNKIMVIKVIRDHTKLGLKEAKDITESAPCVVGEHLDGAASERLRRDLREAGARVR